MALKIERFIPLIQVFDMPRAIAFYRDVLGFEVVSQSTQGNDFDWGMLRLKDTLLMLNTAYETENRPAAPELARVAAHKDTALFFDCPDPNAAYEYLRALDIDVRAPVITGYGMKQVYVSDPDGYQLCFQCTAVEQGAADGQSGASSLK
ncbi:MAG: VOC family protein [Gammaproteobacteria bacterium]